MMININNIFGPTIQGEGPAYGEKVIFIRFQGCDSRCKWCDTKSSWSTRETSRLTINEIIRKVKSLDDNTKTIVITGGNPVLQKSELIKLTDELNATGYTIDLETQGTIPMSWEERSKFRNLVVSPKLDNPDLLEIIKNYRASESVKFKFVVDPEENLDSTLNRIICATRSFDKHMYLQPITVSHNGKVNTDKLIGDYGKLADILLNHELGDKFTLSMQHHALIWGNDKNK